MSIRSKAAVSISILFLLAGWLVGQRGTIEEQGILKLAVMDGDAQTPARVEVLDKEGQGYVAEDALPVGGD